MTSSTKPDLVEHVKRAVIEGSYKRRAKLSRLSELMRFQAESMEDSHRAEDSIVATMEYVRVHVSEKMAHAGMDECPMRYFRQTIDRGLGAGYHRCSIDSDDAMIVFRAMISALLLEIDQEGGADGPR